MKQSLIAAALALALVSTAAIAKGGPDGRAGARGDHGPRGSIAGLDSNHDGRIDRAEFAAGEARRAERAAAREAGAPDRAAKAAGSRGDRAGKPAGARPERQAPPTFDQLDANKDGYIVRREVEAWHERMRPQREAAAARAQAERFTAADLDGDGRLSRIEAGEAMPRLASRFAWLDDNRDGFLSPQELRGPARR